MDIDPQYKTEDGSALRIWRDPVQNNYLTETLGRPVFDEAIFVEVISPGSRSSAPVFEVKRVFHEEMNHAEPLLGPQYAKFKKYIDDFEKDEAMDGTLAGTPLKEWNEISRSMAAALRAVNIFTVEALAELPDSRLNVVGLGGRTWREKAKAYIAAAKDSGHATALAAELERLRTDMAARDEAMKVLAAELEQAKQQLAAQPQPETPAPKGKPGKITADII